jgi:hypothetical protein
MREGGGGGGVQMEEGCQGKHQIVVAEIPVTKYSLPRAELRMNFFVLTFYFFFFRILYAHSAYMDIPCKMRTSVTMVNEEKT